MTIGFTRKFLHILDFDTITLSSSLLENVNRVIVMNKILCIKTAVITIVNIFDAEW